MESQGWRAAAYPRRRLPHSLGERRDPLQATAEATLEQVGTMPASLENIDTLNLVIADRGHVWLGFVEEAGDWLIIRRARTVRRWGTTKGLAQLANEGRQEGTRLDDPAEVRLIKRALIALVPCRAEAWQWTLEG